MSNDDIPIGRLGILAAAWAATGSTCRRLEACDPAMSCGCRSLGDCRKQPMLPLSPDVIIGTSGVELTTESLRHGIALYDLGSGSLVLHPDVRLDGLHTDHGRAPRCYVAAGAGENRPMLCSWSGTVTGDPWFDHWTTPDCPAINGGADWLGWYIGERGTAGVVSRRSEK